MDHRPQLGTVENADPLGTLCHVFADRDATFAWERSDLEPEPGAPAEVWTGFEFDEDLDTACIWHLAGVRR